MMAGTVRKQKGRYDFSKALPSFAADIPAHSSMVTSTGAVDDPGESNLAMDKRKRIIVKINSNVDMLETEHSKKRISERAYRTGRIIQAVFERAAGVRDEHSNLSGIRSDPVTAREIRMICALDNARASVAMIDDIRQCIGFIDAKIVREIIGDNRSYGEVASLRGMGGDRAERYFARRFRDALEYLATDRKS